MVRLGISAAFARRFRVLVIFPLVITGLALTCAAVCLSSLTVLCIALKVSGRPTAEFTLASAPPQFTSDLRNDPATRVASVRDERPRRIQLVSLESRLPSPPSLPRHDLRIGAAASLARVPTEPQSGIQFIRFDGPTLAPMAFTQFCLKYPGDCKPQRMLLAGDRIELNQTRWSELESVSRTVNASIHPERNQDGLAGEKWLLGPLRGDCNDYAVTKRHQLLAKGWPARTVLLSEVVTAWGEHHLVTVVRTDRGDLVLDNLTDQIKPWSRTPYRWVRMQTPKNPNYWASIAEHSA
jgi:predicted transglutaminase-like cysteine proteinase